jgi:hypothetical protein
MHSQAVSKALATCRKANGPDAAACANLFISVVQCVAEEHAPAEHTAHRKCYTSLYKAGLYEVRTGVLW